MYVCVYVCMYVCMPCYRLNGWTDLINIQYSSEYLCCMHEELCYLKIRAPQMGSKHNLAISSKTALMELIKCQYIIDTISQNKTE
jgi:hypothetical protein